MKDDKWKCSHGNSFNIYCIECDIIWYNDMKKIALEMVERHDRILNKLLLLKQRVIALELVDIF